MIRTVIQSSLAVAAAAVVQSTILPYIAVYHVIPDLALIILVYTSYQRGVMVGQLTGFLSGMMLDFLSQAPLGFNMFIRTITGALTGLLKGNFMLDSLFLPALLTGCATLLKAALVFLLHALFMQAIPVYSLSAPTLWIELALNVVLAPFLFGLLNLLGRLTHRPAKGLSKG